MGVFSAAGLYVLVSVVSPRAESENRWKILAIAVTSAVLQAGLGAAVPGLAGAALAVAVSLAVIAVALVFWCGLDRKTAVTIAASYLVLCIGLMIVLQPIAPVPHHA
ncbi:MAG: hypothetical protein JSR36_08230 [Proteobacteria bacterium]|nr:hypothetical protein [Pseudomonadota bacterium]